METAGAWLQGKTVDWDKLYRRKPHRISLPAYPFVKNKYRLSLRDKADITSFRRPEEENKELLFIEPAFEECPIEKGEEKRPYKKRVILYCGRNKEGIRQTEGEANMEQIPLFSYAENIGGKFHEYAVWAFQNMQDILRSKPKEQVLVQIIGERECGFAGLHGLLNTLHLENPNIWGQIIELDKWRDGEAVEELLQFESQRLEDNYIRYQDGKRLIKRWKETIQNEKETCPVPWKDGGIYLITGGMGGLGMIFARDLAEKTKHSTVILTGRSKQNEEIQKKLNELEEMGIQAEYRQADVGIKSETEDLIEEIKAKYKGITGILHSAGTLRDCYMLEKKEAEIREVLWPKVNGTVNLDESTKDMELELFVMFSSAAGVFGNIGQADYAMANAFMDQYAEYRNDLAAGGKRSGKTVSIDWPLWENGGMQVSSKTQEWMERSGKISALSVEDGINSYYHSVSSECAQVLVLKGNLAYLKSQLSETEESPKVISSQKGSIINEEELAQKLRNTLIFMVSDLLKVEKENIDLETSLSDYGFDSIGLTEFVNQINGKFNLELTPVLFFEAPTLKDLVTILLEKHFTSIAFAYPSVQNTDHVKRMQTIPSAPQRPNPINTQTNEEIEDSIVIVGMSGKFPMAEDIEELWENLINEKDCIKEIPKERWDWREYYGNCKQEENKTEIKWGGFIDGVDEFDPAFFGISPREAELMDPQQRLLMTYVWKTIEDAGYSAKSLAGSQLGLFIATMNSSYGSIIAKSGASIEAYSPTGMVPSVGPNRMSYFLDVHGPSEPIETACSSSLVAIHRAITAIRNGDCNAAVVGGINTILTPDGHIGLNKAGALSKNGRCKTFSDQADGYVRSEGVGMIFIKKQRDAENDGDHIYGIIRSSYENHGGRANSLTAPNPKAQVDLLKQAYCKAGIDPRTVTYIEAHGTGTALGDPIEVEAIKTAFKELSEIYSASSIEAVSSCGIGSIKTNIGHLELAAGIAGLIKVLLQFQHKTLVKNLHFEQLNPYINLEDTNLYIVNKAKEWTALRDKEGKTIPRRAGVSSFGFGGANSHVVLEEYIPKEKKPGQTGNVPGSPALIVLSAKNIQGLKARANQLYKELSKKNVTNNELADMAYTLQVGRDEMEERLGIVVTSVEELKQKLKEYSEGKETIERLYHGHSRSNKKIFSLFAEDRGMNKAISIWLEEEKYEKILDLWTKGLQINWNEMYQPEEVKRLRLPTYPFMKERYWIQPANRTPEKNQWIHPLLQINDSTLKKQAFYSVFNGSEFFLSAHKINGDRVLPGVAYLEMARAAVWNSLDDIQEVNKSVLTIRNVVWRTPLIVKEQPVTARIELFAEEDKTIRYEVSNRTNHTDSTGMEKIIHSQGYVKFDQWKQPGITELSERRQAYTEEFMLPEECYKRFQKMGINYGAAHQGITKLYRGEAGVLARIELPECVADTKETYLLHPSILDSALQASIGLMAETKTEWMHAPALPFALEELSVTGRCSTRMWAEIQYNKDRKGEKVQKIDATLYDDNGQCCILMKGITFRILESEEESEDILIMEPSYEECQIESREENGRFEQHLIFYCGKNKEEMDQTEEKFEAEQYFLFSMEEEYAERFQEYALQIFEKIQDKLKRNPKGTVLVQIIGEREHGCSGFLGLLNTAHLENPNILGQVIELEKWENGETVKAILNAESQNPENNYVRYQKGKRFLKIWREKKWDMPSIVPWKDGGNYLIVGGMGGLGMIFAKDIAEKTMQANIILTGRSKQSERMEKQLRDLEKSGVHAEYRQADVEDETGMKALVSDIKVRYKGLTGIIHCAGIIRDSYILKKDKEEIREVLLPKVNGTVNLDEETRDFKLDFFVLFSSIAGIIGNPGQADYAMANAFMDQYAEYRDDLVQRGKRSGKTVTINWPLWEEGGMQVKDEVQTIMKKKTGLHALKTKVGIDSFYNSLTSDNYQMIPMQGMRGMILQTFLTKKNSDEQVTSSDKENTEENKILAKIQKSLKQTVSALLKVKEETIDLDMELQEYGFDSISFTELANALNDTYHLDLLPTLFFENPTIDGLSRYLMLNYHSKVEAVWDGKQSMPSEEVGEYRVSLEEFKSLTHQFPELVLLNAERAGRPVFWFHAAMGGVEVYSDIANKSKRPFYGIQARGWMNESSPLHGVEAMALYYVQIIQKVQPEGPYDLGGYSLGGVIAYEVTRILQEMGEKVNSILMIDSLYNKETIPVVESNLMFQAINTALFSKFHKKPELLTKFLIHRDEINFAMEEETILKALIELGKARGLTQSEEQLTTFIKRSVKIQTAFLRSTYQAQPLLNPDGVTCFYFRNKGSVFLGELEPYFRTKYEKSLEVESNYWKEWEELLPSIRIFDVDASNHMLLLSDPKSYKLISEFCKNLYFQESDQITE
nr:SDR family NAD(P)-dependent oxidoreductase [uncultured Clostridium sp.]